MIKKIAVLFIFIILITGCRENRVETINPSPTPVSTEKASQKLPEMKIMIMKAGKADAIIISIDKQIMVIDTAEKDDGAKINAYLHEQGVNAVDYMIITHLDKDHIGGAAEVLSDIKVKNLIQSNNTENSKDFEAYIMACQKSGVTPVMLTKPKEFSMGEAKIKLIPALKSKYKNDNDYTIMTEITYGEKRFLFAGDAMTERLTEYMADDVSSFDFLKVPHHGVYCDMMPEFIKAVSPTYSVITCSDKDPPDEEVLKLLSEAKSKIFLTNRRFVSVTCDGINLVVQ